MQQVPPADLNDVASSFVHSPMFTILSVLVMLGIFYLMYRFIKKQK